MATPEIEAEIHKMTLSNAVLAEIEEARVDGKLEFYHRRTRCYICCETESADLVNKLLAIGKSNREIIEALASINAHREEAGDKRLITAYGVAYHRRWHFNIDNPVQEAYRRIVERRAAEANLDVINGVDNIVTEYAVMETIMTKGYASVVSEETPVSVRETMDAASRLHEMSAKDASTRKMADLIYMFDRIVRAAQEFIPDELQEAFLARVEGKSVIAALEENRTPSVREFVPARHDEGDEFS